MTVYDSPPLILGYPSINGGLLEFLKEILVWTSHINLLKEYLDRGLYFQYKYASFAYKLITPIQIECYFYWNKILHTEFYTPY